MSDLFNELNEIIYFMNALEILKKKKETENMENTETKMIKDNNKNFTYCKVCDQQLLCNHHKLAISYLNDKSKNEKSNHQPIINLQCSHFLHSMYFHQQRISIVSCSV